jgi:hypothetical protein
MEIEEIENIEVIRTIAATLDIPLRDELDDTLICASLRRLAGFLCPCSSRTLITTLTESLKHLSLSDEDLQSAIEDNLEKLVVWGDLLELKDVATNDVNAKGTWLFAATPGFLVRPNGSIFLCGITPDENSPLSIFSNKIVYEGCKRFIKSSSIVDLDGTLRELGLIEFSERFWFKMPKAMSPEEFVRDMSNQLDEKGQAGQFSEMLILESNTDVSYYNGRWKKLNEQTGKFIAKRPFVYGNYTWCFIEINNGIVERLLDMPLKMGGINIRNCDGAWHLQMAIDKIRKRPQCYSVEDIEGGKTLSFYSPIPSWAERRLLAVGTFSRSNKHCLFSYFIPAADFIEEEKFIREYLWLDLKS